MSLVDRNSNKSVSARAYRAGVGDLFAVLTSRILGVVGGYLAEIDAEYPEDEAVQSGPDAVAEAAYAGDHALRDALLVDVRLVRNVGAYGRIADAGDGGEEAGEPDEPGLRGESVGSELSHLEAESNNNTFSAAKVLD